MTRIIVLTASLLCIVACYASEYESTFLRIRNKYAGIEATFRAPKQPARLAIVHAHPWSNNLGRFPEAELSDKGFAFLSFNTRAVNKDEIAPDGIFEALLLDVAAAVQEMKDRGYEKILLMGWSAGGPLMSLYENVAENGNQVFAGERKLFKFPGFFEKDHAPIRLPKADGIIFINPIDGTPTTFINRLDPSIIDEATSKRDPSLDMFNPANGYDPKLQRASYSKEFVEKYSRAQAARMNRLIDIVQSGQTTAKAGQGPYTDGGLIVIPGTRARLFYTDPHLGDATSEHLILPENRMEAPRNNRAQGHYSLFGKIPDRNAAVEGAIVHTYESFLSMHAIRAKFVNPMATTVEQWGVDIESTNNTTVGNMKHVSAPWILFSGTADDKMNTAELIYNEAMAKDKAIVFLRGSTHGLTSVDSKRFSSTERIRQMAVEQMAKWINERFGTQAPSQPNRKLSTP